MTRIIPVRRLGHIVSPANNSAEPRRDDDRQRQTQDGDGEGNLDVHFTVSRIMALIFCTLTPKMLASMGRLSPVAWRWRMTA